MDAEVVPCMTHHLEMIERTEYIQYDLGSDMRAVIKSLKNRQMEEYHLCCSRCWSQSRTRSIIQSQYKEIFSNGSYYSKIEFPSVMFLSLDMFKRMSNNFIRTTGQSILGIVRRATQIFLFSSNLLLLLYQVFYK